MGRVIWRKSCQQACRRPHSGPLHLPCDRQLKREQVVAGVLQEAPDGIGLSGAGDGDPDHDAATAGVKL